MIAATIIGAVLAAGTAIVSGVMNNNAIGEANAEGMRLANVTRQDTLRQQRYGRKQAAAQLGISKRAAAVGERSQALSEKTFSANRRSQIFNRGLGLMAANPRLVEQRFGTGIRKAA